MVGIPMTKWQAKRLTLRLCLIQYAVRLCGRTFLVLGAGLRPQDWVGPGRYLVAFVTAEELDYCIRFLAEEGDREELLIYNRMLEAMRAISGGWHSL